MSYMSVVDTACFYVVVNNMKDQEELQKCFHALNFSMALCQLQCYVIEKHPIWGHADLTNSEVTQMQVLNWVICKVCLECELVRS